MRIAICDDEQIYRDQLKVLLQPFINKYAWIKVYEFTDGAELLDKMREGQSFDIIFLDVEMKIKDGITTATEIRSFNENVFIIFTTSFTKFITDAMSLNAFQYLVKPVNKALFNREFARALKSYYAKRRKFQISDKNGITALEISDIVYIESYIRHIFVYTTAGEKFETVGKLDDEEKKLLPFGFSRTHRSYLVNMAHIKTMSELEIVCKNGMVVPISARKKTDVRKQLNEFLSGVENAI